MTAETTLPSVPAPDAPAYNSGSFLPGYLLFLMASASAAASEEFHQVIRQNGLRVPEWRVLASLHDQDSQMVTRLAELALLEQSRLTRIIDQMDARGLVMRQSDPKDRRRVRVCLTPGGRALAERMIALALEHEASLIARLPDGQGAKLQSLLAELRACLKAAPEGPA